MSQEGIIKVGVAGVRGYKGFETARLIARHPNFRVAMIASDVMAGHRLRDLDRDFVRDGNAQAVGYDDLVSAARDYGVELMFLATEPEVCADLGGKLIDAKVRVMDMSGAHALKDARAHAETYGFTWPEAAKTAVFGLTEHQEANHRLDCSQQHFTERLVQHDQTDKRHHADQHRRRTHQVPDEREY